MAPGECLCATLLLPEIHEYETNQAKYFDKYSYKIDVINLLTCYDIRGLKRRTFILYACTMRSAVLKNLREWGWGNGLRDNFVLIILLVCFTSSGNVTSVIK